MRARPAPAAWGVLLATVATWAAASRSPSPWLAILSGLLGATLLVGAITPALLLRRLRAGAMGPRDAVVDVPTQVTIVAAGGGIGDARLIAPESAWTSEDSAVEIAFPERGIVSTLPCELRTAAPLGLVWWTRRTTLSLAESIAVAPRERALTVRDAEAHPEERPAVRAGGDLTRTVRAYRHGDPQRLVHWPATARTGRVMVRELDAPDDEGVEIVVDLSGPSERAERAAERAGALARDAVAAGTPTTLVTMEAQRVVRAAVVSRLDIGRRLARADTLPVDAASASAGAIWVRG